jgi:ankyrin
MTALNQAAFSGKSDLAALLLDHGADIESADCDEYRPIHNAVQFGHYKTVELLLKRGACIDAPDQKGDTPIFIAIGSKDTATVGLLLRWKADTTILGSEGYKPIHWAAMYDNTDIALMLVNSGANVNEKLPQGLTPLHCAVAHGRALMTRFLLKRGANINAKCTIEFDLPGNYSSDSGEDGEDEGIPLAPTDSESEEQSSETGGTTPLMLAARLKSPECLKVLLTASPNIQVKDDDGDSAIVHAVVADAAENVELLLNAGARVDELHSGETLLHVAVCNDAIEIIKLLLKKGIKVSQQSSENLVTPLQVACQLGKKEIVELLLSAGAKVKEIDLELCTPLHKAAQYGQIEVVQLLLSHKAMIDAKESSGMTPLFLAAFYGHTEVGELLIKHKAKVSIACTDGRLPIHAAAKGNASELIDTIIRKSTLTIGGSSLIRKGTMALSGSSPVMARSSLNGPVAIHYASGSESVNVLLNNKSPIDITDTDGDTPLHWKAMYGEADAAFALVRRGAQVDPINNLGDTPLMVAIQNNQPTVVKVLLQESAKPVYEGRNGLLRAMEIPMVDVDIVSELLDTGLVDIDQPNDELQEPPLVTAILTGHTELANLLIERGADIRFEIQGHVYNSPLLFSAFRKQWDITQKLLEHHVPMMSTDTAGWYLLHYVASYGHDDPAAVKFAQSLIEWGHPMDVTNNDGYTPADLVRSKNFPSQELLSVLTGETALNGPADNVDVNDSRTTEPMASNIEEVRRIEDADDERVETATALRDCDTTEDNWLCFPNGATIVVLEKDNDEWWRGEYAGKSGWFPPAYVQLDEPAPSKIVETATALRDCDTTEENWLCFPNGATIVVLEKDNHEWWRGEYAGKSGWFPPAYVQLDEPAPSNTEPLMISLV